MNPAPQPTSAVRLSDRCVLLKYFDGDVASSVDEHFTRSLKAAASRYDLQAVDGHITTLHQQLYRRTASQYRTNSLHRTIKPFCVTYRPLSYFTSI